MTADEYTPRMRALDRIARSISEHQHVRREDGPFSTCKNPACNGVIFLTRRDRYNHQAAVIANDLQRDLDFDLEYLRDEAAKEGREVTEEELAEIRSEYLILAPWTAPEPALPGKDNR
jgi:hypothetical protein